MSNTSRKSAPRSSEADAVITDQEIEQPESAAKTPRGGAYHYYDDGEDVPSQPPKKWAHLPMAEQIAEAIVECLNKNGECWIIDIRAMGFSLNDIARYWPDACAMAEKKRPRPKAGG